MPFVPSPRRLLPAALCLALTAASGASATDGTLPSSVEAALSKQNVVWDSPSANARGSMPVGNGDIGLNVWVEPSGDLVMLIGKTDSFDEFNRLLKPEYGCFTILSPRRPTPS